MTDINAAIDAEGDVEVNVKWTDARDDLQFWLDANELNALYAALGEHVAGVARL